MSKESLKKAVDIIGGQVALAQQIRALMPGSRVQQGHVWNWLNSKSDLMPPAEYCRAIEAATAGQVSRYELRPDVFGEALQPQQEAA